MQTPSAARTGPFPLHPYPQLISTRFTQRDGLPDAAALDILVLDGRVCVQTLGGWVEWADGLWRRCHEPPDMGRPAAMPAAPEGATILSAAPTPSGEWWAITTAGALEWQDGAWSALDLPRDYRHRQPMPHADAVLRQVALDPSGHIWIATSHGAFVTDGDRWWKPLDRLDGMPFEDLTCVAFGANGDVWGGSPHGAWRLRDGRWRAFHGRRWLPSDHVVAIGIEPTGIAWLATSGGVARIEERALRLRDKADHYEAITQARHNRRGWVTGCVLKTPGEPDAGYVHEASDNDGLWTALYVAAESFRYAVTAEPEAASLARRSMNALLDLVRLSGYEGFPARAIVDQSEQVVGVDLDETVRVPGEPDPIWYTPPGHEGILAKGDTSSDELDGHYLAWYVYHELVADEDEKKEIARVAAAVTDNLLRNDLTLVGHTGRKTRWGVFGPKHLNNDPRWVEERGLNSAELLCYLLVAHHLTGESRYQQAYEDLIERHHYLLNVGEYRRGAPWHSVNHSDDELAYAVYYPLLRLEQRPDRLALLRHAVASTWLGGPGTTGIGEEKSPFYNFVYGALTGQPCRIEDAVETLQDWPWELVDWTVSSAARADVTVLRARGEQRSQLDRVLPASERRLMRWNGNPWQPDGGADGRSEEDAGAWLLAYWIGRYHGMIFE
ncbi:MAG TPA: hypothetical protein VLH79_00795 [Chthonomonadales bacterium]|nr:hypothetical protein [Chthonomonadales bacterium]